MPKQYLQVSPEVNQRLRRNLTAQFENMNAQSLALFALWSGATFTERDITRWNRSRKLLVNPVHLSCTATLEELRAMLTRNEMVELRVNAAHRVSNPPSPVKKAVK
jgi:hypothetical protein